MAVEILRINGSRYKAVPELTSIEELDTLTRFFLDEVLPVEPRIEELLNVFGLPKRQVEDILADLLKHNLISLRLDSGTVELQNNQPLRRQRKAGVTIEVWQDETTGSLLPFKLVAALGKPVPGAKEIPLSAHGEEFTGFLELPDSQILSRLAPIDPAIRISAGGWIPEALREKARIEPYPIYVRVNTATMNDLEVKFAHAPELPYWLTKQWSRKLVQIPQVSGNQVDDAATRALLETGVGPQNPAENEESYSDSVIFGSADLTTLLKRWDNATTNVLECEPDKRTLLNRHHRAELRMEAIEAQLAFRGNVSLIESPVRPHLTEMWDQTDRALVVVSNEWTAELLQRVSVLTVGREDHDAHLILVDCSEGRKNKPLLAIKETFSATSGRDVEFLSVPMSVGSSYCVSDGQRARLGSLKSLATANNPAFEVSGLGAIEAVLSPLVRNVDVKGGGRWLLSQLQRSTMPEAPGSDEYESSTAIRQVTIEMKALLADIRQLIDEVIDDANSDATAERNTRDIRILRDRNSDLRQRQIDIVTRWQTIDISLPQAISSPQETLVQFCRWVGTPGRQHDLEIFASGIPADSAKALGAMLVRTMQKGTRVILHLTYPASRKSMQRLRDLYGDVLEHSLFTMHFVRAQLPNVVMVDGGFVALSQGNWFRDADSNHYGFLFHSSEFVQQLREFARRKRGEGSDAVIAKEGDE